MKYTILLIGILSLAAFFGRTMNVYGQSDIRIGITGGSNASRIKTSTNLTDLLWSYNVGLAFEKGLSDDLSLASELVYSKQGSSIDNVSSGEYITHFDYLALPVFVRYSPGGKNVFFQAGGKFGYLVNDKEIYTYNNTESNLDHLRQWDAGVLGGIGYRIGKHVVVDARYYYGLTPLIKKHTVLDPVTLKPIFYGADRWYNRVWSLNLTVYL
jgi:hypothetical protein